RPNHSPAAPAADAPRSEQAWVALRAAVPHAGPAHGLHALAAEAPTAPPTPTPSDGPAPAATGTPMDLGSSLGSSSGGPQASAGLTHGHEGGAMASPDVAPPSAFASHLHEALQQTLETVGAQVTLWQAGRAQHASLTFEEGWDEPLAVDVSLDQGVAHLSFRTDDEAARRLIQTQAPQVLADALARAGLTLGQLDVGGRQSSPQENERPAPRTLRVAASGDSRWGPLPTGPVHRPTPRLGGLDVYA
ncbi:MAG: flagellar hook-length control protein FliK, partial [Tepidimonas sp.]|uniref:flagellar hook-length control protein FliK n=1 Tax=Tepidimonas sp. TaxID=2002775 RepID=UPI00298ED7FC